MTSLIETEHEILGIGSEFLPPEAIKVRDGAELTLTERVAYTTWLAEQCEIMASETTCRETPECQASSEGHCTCPHVVAAEAAAEAAAAARDAARAALRDSDEPREYEINDGNAWWTITSRPSTLKEDVAESVRDGDWDNSSSWWWHGVSRCELTGEEESHTVEMPAEEPECEEDEHDWHSPHSVLGGLKDNPGVWGKGGGVIVREVCAHCGVYRVTDTWAQDPQTGEQGLRAVSYEDADEDSLAWIAERRKGRS